MTRAAITRLKATGKHYCLLIEGSRIDHGLHSSDAASAAKDAIAYSRAFKEALKEVSEGQNDVQILSVADHSTGGLTLGMQPDWQLTFDGARTRWKNPPRTYRPEVLVNVSMSTGNLSSRLCCDPSLTTDTSRREFITSMLGLEPDETNLAQLANLRSRMVDVCSAAEAEEDWPSGECGMGTQLVLNGMVQHAAGLGMTTSSHTGEDVHVYAAGTHAKTFRGAMENSEIGKLHLGLLNLSLDPITQALNDCKVPVHPIE